MLVQTVIRPINSLIFISDLNGATAPEWEKDRIILSSEACISVGCYPEQDGPTKVILGDDRDARRKRVPEFSGKLKIPSGIILISDVLRAPILQMEVGQPLITVNSWLSHPMWPDEVAIGVSRNS